MPVDRETVMALIAERDLLDKEIAQCFDVLKQNNVDMDQSLVDAEGYPRNDIDIYGIRNARCNIRCKQNDRKVLTERIEKAMYALHENGGNDMEAMQVEESPSSTAVHRTSNRSFARIDHVTPGSPAAEAGLKANDEIIQFGSLHADNFRSLNQVAEIVQSSIEKSIRVTVNRSGHAVRSRLEPKKWAGEGLLGCQFNVIK